MVYYSRCEGKKPPASASLGVVVMAVDIYEQSEEDAACEAYLAECEYAEWERQVEDEAYNAIIIPEYMAGLDAEAATL